MVQVAGRSDLLSRASDSVYSLGVEDASAMLAEKNVAFGLAKMKTVLEDRGVDSGRVSCLFSPDGGITRNQKRWASGFGYGCLIRWPTKEDAGRNFAFPELRPNACGVIVVRIEGPPSAHQLWQRIQSMGRKRLTIDGSDLVLNIGVSNHFVEVSEVTSSIHPDIRSGEVVAVIHTSPSELKSEMYDYDAWIERGGRWCQTEYGPLLVLEGPVAEEYNLRYRLVDEFAQKKRSYIAKTLFGECDEICNVTHQGLSGDGQASLGVYRSGESSVYPLTLRPDLPTYLMNIRQNLSLQAIKGSGWHQRAVDLGHLDDILASDIMPHGGGYSLNMTPDSISAIQMDGGKKVFELREGQRATILSDTRDLPYGYRGEEILEAVQRHSLADVVSVATPLYTLKYA